MKIRRGGSQRGKTKAAVKTSNKKQAVKKATVVQYDKNLPRKRLFQQLIEEATTPQDMIDIVRTAVSRAKRGDDKARKWLSDHIVGLPILKIAPIEDPDGANPYRSMTDEELTNILKQINGIGTPSN